MAHVERPAGNRRTLSHSQNFLRNAQFVSELLGKTDINSIDLVVEIGAGKGIITQELAKRAGHVLALEIDPNLAERLRNTFDNVSNVTITVSDILRWPLPQTPYKVFSNIPFNMTADIVSKLLGDVNPPLAAYLILQNVAAERFIGSPLAKNTQVSVLLQPWFEMGIVAKIDRQQFTPVPKVDTVLAVFQRRQAPLIESHHRQLFRDFVIYGFNQWQPTVLDSFKSVFTGRQRAILSKEMKIENAKPSDLSIEQWAALFHTYLRQVPDERKRTVVGAERRLNVQQQKLTKRHRTR